MRRNLQHLSLVIVAAAASTAVACVPMRGTMPTTTWRPEDPTSQCTADALGDTLGSSWTAFGHSLLVEKLDRRETAVVSALGCRVEVLEECTAPGRYEKTKDRYELDEPEVVLTDLEGRCDRATHFVKRASSGKAARVELEPLSLGAELTGTWNGVMRQPGGPYEVYDVSLELEQYGDRVSGVRHIQSVDRQYWGTLRFEGRIEGTTLLYADVEVMDDNLGLFYEWCTLGGFMVADQSAGRLTGPWKAFGCGTGSMDLARVSTSEKSRDLQARR
ncbi:MAG: hypothetical protein HOW73_35845 [Polyangiaceae bacterium]|nr:hypothetical protein [Polyangiaceae bacterium]